MKRIILSLILIIFASQLFSQQIETVVQAGHYAGITAVCYSPDGKLIATGSFDKTIILWRSSDGKEIRSLRGSNHGINRLEFKNDGKTVLSVNNGGELITWDIETGKILLKKKPAEDVFTYASFSPDGTLIVAGTRKSGIPLIDAVTGDSIRTIKVSPVDNAMERGFDYPITRTVRFSSDGKYIIAGAGDYTAILFDAATGKELKKYKKIWSTCTSCESEAVLSPDGRFVVSAYSDSVKIFDRASGKFLREFYGQGGDPEALMISKDMKYFSGIEYGVAEVWDFNSGKLLLKTGDYNNDKILCAALSPDGKHLIAGSEKRVAEIYEITSGKNILSLRGYLNQMDERLLSHSYMYWVALINEAKLSPDGTLIAVGRTGNNVKLIDFNTGRVIRTLSGHKSMVISLSFSRDGKFLATGGIDGQVIIWDVEKGSEVQKISSPDERLAVFSVDISHNNKMFACAGWDGLVRIFDFETGKLLQAVSPHERTGVYQVRFSANDVYFISAGLDGKLKLSEIDTGEEVRTFKGHTDLVNSVYVSPDGSKIITAGLDGTIRVWDFLSGLQTLKIRAHTGGVFSAKFDPTGKYIISGGDDFLVRQWNASTGEMLMELEGHNGQVGDVNITGDLRHIISGSRDGSIRIWDVAERKELAAMVFINENDWFIRNPAGYFDASDGAFSSISFAKGSELYSISQFFNEFYRPGLFQSIFSGEGASRQDILQTIEKFPPPSIEFLNPETNTNTDNPAVTCMVRVTNKGGGVNEFRVMHNGKRQIVDASDLLRMSKAGQEALKTFDLLLVPGENEISVSAYSKGGIESIQKNVKVNYNGLQKTSDCYVLSIGINKYENDNLDLSFAKPDAQAFASYMNLNAGKLFNKLYSFTLYDKDATKAAIIGALANISKTMKKEDVFIFFYAGHGSTNDNQFYFITSEITGLYQQDRLVDALHVAELQEKFKDLPALKQVIFIDACHSGGSVETLAMRGATEEKALAQLSRSSGVHVLASSDSEQQSAEIKSLGHGVFTYVLLEALKGKADGAPADSKITIYELKSYIDDQVPEVSYNMIRHKQFPSTFSIGHDFPIVVD